MAELVDIKDISGNIRLSTPINEGSKRKFQLMSSDYITLKFSLAEPVYFQLGDYIDDENIGLFELVDLYKPTYNTTTGGYDYELKLDAYYWKWKNKKFFYTPQSSGREASWNLTDTLKVHMDVFLKNLEVLGYQYKGKVFTCKIDDSVDDSSKLISYDNMNMLDALSQMSQTFECEWWIEKDVIRFGRCEHGDPVDFEIGVNVSAMNRSDSQTSYATRIYAFGSTRNIPQTYRKKLVFDVKKVNGRDISDTSRVLNIDYFPTDDQIGDKFKASVRTSGYVKAGLNDLNYESLSNNPAGGTYAIKSEGASFNIGTIVPPAGSSVEREYLPSGIYSWRWQLRYKINDVEKSYGIGGNVRTIYDNQEKELTDKVVLNKEINIERGATDLKLYIVFQLPGSISSLMMILAGSSGDITIENVAKSANASVTFTTGPNEGQTFDAIYNPDFLIGEAANVLRLPEGISVSAGNMYTINNIIKSRIPISYFSDDKALLTVEGIVTKHLMMPESVPYIDAYPNMYTEEAIEQIIVFDDIYPSRIGGIGDVYTHPYTDITENPDGSKTEEKWTAWRFKDADLGFHFSESYRLSGEELRIVFQSGPLAGMDFEVIFNPYDSSSDTYQPERLEDGTWNPRAQVYEVKRNDDYGRMLPDDILHPTSGDTYILYGYDPQFVSDKLIPDAEKEVEERAKEYINELKQDPSTYDSTMMPDYIYGVDPDTGMYDPAFAKKFSIGQKVNLINKAYFEEGRISRIIGYEYPLDVPYDSLVYTVGETAPYSKLGELESKIDSLTYRKERIKQQIISSGGSSTGTGEGTAKFTKNVEVTVDKAGYFKAGDVILEGTTVVDAFIRMLSQKSVGELRSKISTANDVEFGTSKGYITYTASRNGQGPMESAYYDENPNNKLNFSEEVGGIQTAVRQLEGTYSQNETYKATVIYTASEDGTLPRQEIKDTISVNVRRKWFAGICSSIPKTSAEVRALGSSGLYKGAGTYKFDVNAWKMIAICLPEGTLSELSVPTSPGNIMEDTGIVSGPTTISVEGANGSTAANYKMWIIQTETMNDSNTFTFKTV